MTLSSLCKKALQQRSGALLVDATVNLGLVMAGRLREDAGAVLDAAASPEHASVPFVRPRYPQDAAPNPVLVRRSAWALAAGLDGDRGLGRLIANRPDLVVEVPVEGDNPDVDTPADLAAVTAAVSPEASR